MNIRRYHHCVKGFSLVEVVLAMGITVFVLVALLAAFPIGLDAESASQRENRSTQLAQAIFTMLQSGSFTDAKCYGLNIDLSQIETSMNQVAPSSGAVSATAPSLLLYGSFPVSAPVSISTELDPEAEHPYVIELRFRRILSGEQVEASEVLLSISAQHKPYEAFHYASIVGNYQSRR